MSRCIWCLREHPDSAIEHVIPQAVGCPPDLVLRDGEVCRPCNSHLGVRVDVALVHNFEQMLAIAELQATGKTHRRLAGIGNMQISDMPSGQHVAFSMGSTAIVDEAGTRVGPLRRDRRHATATFRDLGNGQGEISGEIAFIHDDRFSRALHKIALELLVFTPTPDIVYESRFDLIRDYVMRGVGTRRVVMAYTEHDWKARKQQVILSPDGGVTAEFLFCGCVFFVDLSPQQTFFPRLEATTLRGTVYTWTPIVRDGQPTT